jgi:hypothetical protein
MKRVRATRRHIQITATGESRISNIRIDGELVVSAEPWYSRLFSWVKRVILRRSW